MSTYIYAPSLSISLGSFEADPRRRNLVAYISGGYFHPIRRCSFRTESVQISRRGTGVG